MKRRPRSSRRAFLAFWIAATAPDAVGPLVAVDGLPFLPALMNPSATAVLWDFLLSGGK